MNRRSMIVCALVSGLVGCGDGTSEPMGEGGASDGGVAGEEGDEGDEGGEDGPCCEGDPAAERRTLPGTGESYCIKFHPDCVDENASCPLVITVNTGGAYFDRVDDPDAYGTFMTVEHYGPRDGNEVKDSLAELPRVLIDEFAGLDDERIYLVGWSAGAGVVYRGTCHASKGWDESSYGTTSDIYAAIATLGGCPSCSDGFAPLADKLHVFATNGTEDQFGGNGCFENLQQLARTNGCSDVETDWCSASAQDEYAVGADGSSNAQKVTFGDCPGGDVVGYRFPEEGHVVSYKKHFDPKIQAYDMVWRFLEGRTKVAGGTEGHGTACE